MLRPGPAGAGPDGLPVESLRSGADRRQLRRHRQVNRRYRPATAAGGVLAGLVEQAGAAADPGVGQGPRPGPRHHGSRSAGGHATDLLVAGQRQERRCPAVGLHPHQIEPLAPARPAPGPRADALDPHKWAFGRSRRPTRAAPAAPGQGPAVPPTGTTDRAGSRSSPPPDRPCSSRRPSSPITTAPASVTFDRLGAESGDQSGPGRRRWAAFAR